MARKATITLEAETSKAEENVRELNQEMDRLGEGARGAEEDIERSTEDMQESYRETADAAERAASSTQSMGSASSSASQLVFDLSDATQDMTHSLSAGANNAGFLFEQFGRVKSEAGGLTPALKTIGSQFLGPAGIAFGITTVLQHSDSLINFFTQSGKAAEDAAKKYKDAAGELLSVTNPRDDQQIELGLEAARETATRLEEEIGGIDETIENLQEEEGMQSAVRGGVPESGQDEQRIQALRERRRQLQAGLSTVQEQVGQIEAQLALQRRLEDVTGQTAQNQSEGTEKAERQADAMNGMAVSAKQAAENLSTVNRFLQQRGRSPMQRQIQQLGQRGVPSMTGAMMRGRSEAGLAFDEAQGAGLIPQFQNLSSVLGGQGQQQGTPQGLDVLGKSLKEIQQEYNVSKKKAEEFKQAAQSQFGRVASAAGQMGQALVSALKGGKKEAEDIAGVLLQGVGGVLQAIPGVGQVAGPVLGQLGGLIPAFHDGGEVPARLQPGEFVVNQDSAQAASGLLKAINNSPDMAGAAQGLFTGEAGPELKPL